MKHIPTFRDYFEWIFHWHFPSPYKKESFMLIRLATILGANEGHKIESQIDDLGWQFWQNVKAYGLEEQRIYPAEWDLCYTFSNYKQQDPKRRSIVEAFTYDGKTTLRERLDALLQQDTEATIQAGGIDGLAVYSYYAGIIAGQEGLLHLARYRIDKEARMKCIARMVIDDYDWYYYHIEGDDKDDVVLQYLATSTSDRIMIHGNLWNEPLSDEVYLVTHDGRILYLDYTSINEMETIPKDQWKRPDKITDVTAQYPDTEKIMAYFDAFRDSLPTLTPEYKHLTDTYADTLYMDDDVMPTTKEMDEVYAKHQQFRFTRYLKQHGFPARIVPGDVIDDPEPVPEDCYLYEY